MAVKGFEESKLRYIETLLRELRGISDDEGADMLTYLIEMALAECHDVLDGKRPLSLRRHVEDD